MSYSATEVPIFQMRYQENGQWKFNPKLNAFFQKARCCAKQVLKSPSFLRGSSGVRSGNFIYNDYSTYVFSTNDSYSRKEENKKELFLLGTLVTLTASAVFGFVYKNYQTVCREMREYKEIKGYWKSLLNSSDLKMSSANEIQINDKISCVFRKYHEILKEQLKQDRLNCYTAGAFIASGAVLALGAGVSSSGLMVLGGTTLVAATAYTVFRIAYQMRRDNLIIENATGLKQDIETLYETLKNP